MIPLSSSLPKKDHVASLDGLRALAIIAVWAIHAGVPGSSLGWLGVDLFFTLSGFLITTLMVKEYEKTKTVNIFKFWGRRFLRLMPAYYLYIGSLTLLIIVGHYHVIGGWSPGGYLASLWFYFNNFLPDGGFGELDQLFFHIWSLALEEQFYLVWPALFLLAIRMRRSFLLPMGILTTMLVYRPFASNFELQNLPQARGMALVLGCALALWARDQGLRGSLPSWLISTRVRLGWVAATIGLIILLSIVNAFNGIENKHLLDDEMIKRWILPVLSLQFSIIITMLWYGRQDWLTQFLSWSPLTYIGKISYGIYLFHMIAHYLTWEILLKNINNWPSYPKMGLRLILYGVLSVGIAALSYHFYEQSFLRFKQRLR